MTAPQICTFSNVNDTDDELCFTLCGADILTVHTTRRRYCGKQERHTWRRYANEYEAEAAFRELADYWSAQAGRHLSVAVTGL